MTMNTREREVMDALATALRMADSLLDSANIGVGADEIMFALTAYDALLAEGSASSEGAEAVAQSTPMPNTGTYFPKCDNCGKPVHMHAAPAYLCPVVPCDVYAAHPQPAQGEQCSAMEVFRIAGGDVDAIADAAIAAQQHTASDDTPSKSRLKRIAAQQRQGGAPKHDGPCWRNSHSDCGC